MTVFVLKAARQAVMVAICLLNLSEAFAQLDVTFPVERMVIQRDNDNWATVQIAGSFAQPLDAVESRVVARQSGQGTSTDWAVLQANPANGQFNGTLRVRGGWYTIEVRGLRNGQVVATDNVQRFGVGEVFAIVGHSNAQGSGCFINGIDYCPTMEGAVDDRVTVVAVDQSTPEFQEYENTADTRYLPGLGFSKLLTYSGMSPFAKVSWFWGYMGDQLVQRINVPVLLYNAGFGGTNMEHNYKAANDIPFEHGFCKYSLRMPFVNLRNLMNLYVPSTGIRAILLQHGENDRGNSTADIIMHHYGTIDKLRQEYPDKQNLAWIVALSSFVSGRFENVRLAQRTVYSRPGYKTYLGPDLDVISSLEDRPDGIHYSPVGQRKVGALWAAALNNDTLQAAQPYPAQLQPLATVACASGNTLQLTQPDGYSYTWNNGSTSRSLTTGSGTYSARLRNAQNQHVFPPAVTVPAEVRPGRPTINSAGNTSDICQIAGLTLTSSYTALNQWSTGATSSSVVITTPGTYTLQAKNAVYGCLSDAVTRTINLAGADLSLSLHVSRRTPAVGDTVTFTLTVRNESNCDARAVTMQNRLPANVSFVSSADGLSVTNGIVQGSLSVVPARATLTRRFVVRLNSAGMYQNAAELTASLNPDPDSQPNSGTDDGQDDESAVDLRTLSAATTSLYTSPNPAQIPLPVVQSNQPVPDNSKADLSLTLQTSTRVLSASRPVSVTLTVRNAGGMTASSAGVRCDLPAGLQFSSSSSGMTASGQAISGVLTQIAPGQSKSLVFEATPTGSGLFTLRAQISAASPADPDSTPNNGTGKGEDDEAIADLRVGL